MRNDKEGNLKDNEDNIEDVDFALGNQIIIPLRDKRSKAIPKHPIIDLPP